MKMCTALTYQAKAHYFGRNLDLEYSYPETVTITPRGYRYPHCRLSPPQYAMIGVAYVVDGMPLYYDAMNEKGLAAAGLRFDAVYGRAEADHTDLAAFEVIPFLLGQCADLQEAQEALRECSITSRAFSHSLPAAPLHWLIADSDGSITLECTADGMRVEPNEIGVLTNNPGFEYQQTHLRQFLSLSSHTPSNTFAKGLKLSPYSLGMGSMGLPGDYSSTSRFVRAAFVKWNALSASTEAESVSQFFHILEQVTQVRGCTQVRENEYEFTRYSACCNLDEGIYYYRT